jgi:CRISPR-associated protein (TIGR03986 family)
MTNRDQTAARAHAPYNFVPLPDRVVAAEPVPDHDRYHPDRYTGHFDVTLTTETPLYIRGMLTEQEAIAKEQHKDKADFFQLGGRPIIPGSSLRGMIRSLVEIIVYGKITRMSDKPKVFFRAVAAKSDDPLGYHYRQVTGTLGANVQAGYLKREGENWCIQPATKLAGRSFIKVRDLDGTGRVAEDSPKIDGLIHLNSAGYKVQYWDVVLDSDIRMSKSGPRASVRSPNPDEKRQGMLVCTGNMAESSKSSSNRVPTGRRNFVFVPNPDSRVAPLEIDPQAVRDYLDGLTPFQIELPFDEKHGCLVEGRPVFYVVPQHGKRVFHFGHAPFSRIAAITSYTDTDGRQRHRAVTPRDFVPAAGRDSRTHYDIAEALFGYVGKGDADTPQGDKSRATASRVSVTDAHPVEGQTDFFEDEFIPKILSGPKPTTFQHYLEQPNGEKTAKQDLRHYAHSVKETRIRGHKLYWRQKGVTVAGVREMPAVGSGDKQHTRMRPVKPGMSFTFRVHFENLSDVELGALAWALTLPGNDQHRHQLGMGKPYGMGVVKLEAALYLSDRMTRYGSLLAEWDGALGENQPNGYTDYTGYIEQFERHICAEIAHNGTFSDIPRIKELLTMLVARQPAGDAFRYMTIEPNEYRDRPVLPYPSVVVKAAGQLAAPSRAGATAPQTQTRVAPPPVRKSVPEIGDEVRGKVFSTDGGLSFEPEGYEGYCEGHIPQEKVCKQRKEGDPVKARVIKIEPGDPVTLICEQIDTGKKIR